MSNMQTPAITLWFPEQCLLGLFILKKQLASQDMFLVRSDLSITAYLFLVLYRSTFLQSLSFLKNIKTFPCKQKLVNNRRIPSKKQPYNHNSFSKKLRASTALQSRSFLKNIETFLYKQKLVNNHSIPSKQQPYNHDSFSKILETSTALQSHSFLKNIENFLCKQKIVNNRSMSQAMALWWETYLAKCRDLLNCQSLM